MAYITLSNSLKITSDSDLLNLNLKGSIYKIPIYFFSKYEENALLAIQELLKDPENFFTHIYKKLITKDTYSYIYEGKKPSYHNDKDCPRMNAQFRNFQIPNEIKEQGPDAVKKFRLWFEENKGSLQNPNTFAMRLHAKYGILTNPKAINYDNSGYVETENIDIKKLEEDIDKLIKDAGRYYHANERNKEILSKFSRKTYYAYNTRNIDENDTKYSNSEIKSFLLEYDKTYKKPLRRMLVSYYRLKLNPEIEMEGKQLEAIGFAPCGHCASEVNASDSWKPSNWVVRKIDKNDDLPF